MVKEMIAALKVAEEQETIKNTLSNLPRYSSFVPFSRRLNDWLENWYSFMGGIIQYTDVDDFDPEDIVGTFERNLKLLNEQQLIIVWTGASDKTIYGKSQINHIARAWHDYTHLTNYLGYDALSEIQVAGIQAAQLPQDWWFEKQLIQAEVTGQVLYFNKYKQFPEDKRKFTFQYLKTGTI